MKLNKNAIAGEFLRRLKKNEVAARVIFDEAAIFIDPEQPISLNNVILLHDANSDLFTKLCHTLYPDAVAVEKQYSIPAAADGVTAESDSTSAFKNINWVNVLGSTLAGFGTGFASSATTDSTADLALQQAAYETRLAEQKSESYKKIIIIVAVVVALLAAVLLTVTLKKK